MPDHARTQILPLHGGGGLSTSRKAGGGPTNELGQWREPGDAPRLKSFTTPHRVGVREGVCNSGIHFHRDPVIRDGGYRTDQQETPPSSLL